MLEVESAQMSACQSVLNQLSHLKHWKYSVKTYDSSVIMMAGGRDNERSASFKTFLDDLFINDTDEEIKCFLSQQDNVEATAGNTLAEKYAKSIKSPVNQQMRGIKFYISNSSNELKTNVTRENTNVVSTKDRDILKFYRNDSN